jgi:flagellar hook-associated protein 3 FlgL
VDIAEAAVEFQTAQTVYQATLATISKVVQPTLVDYLT